MWSRLVSPPNLQEITLKPLHKWRITICHHVSFVCTRNLLCLSVLYLQGTALAVLQSSLLMSVTFSTGDFQLSGNLANGCFRNATPSAAVALQCFFLQACNDVQLRTSFLEGPSSRDLTPGAIWGAVSAGEKGQEFLASCISSRLNTMGSKDIPLPVTAHSRHDAVSGLTLSNAAQCS